MRSRCKTCFREISPKRFCSGHGGGGGSESTSKQTAGLLADKLGSDIDLVDLSFSMEDCLSNELNNELFNADIIPDLLNNDLLFIDNDHELNTLTIALQCELDSLTPEQTLALKRFINAILKEFQEFKIENHLSDVCVNAPEDKKGNRNSLSIKLLTQTLYDAFIQRLANNLLPSPTPISQASKEETLRASPVTLNPQLTEPKPLIAKKIKTDEQMEVESKNNVQDIHVILEDEEQKEVFNPPPFSLKLQLK